MLDGGSLPDQEICEDYKKSKDRDGCKWYRETMAHKCDFSEYGKRKNA